MQFSYYHDSKYNLLELSKKVVKCFILPLCTYHIITLLKYFRPDKFFRWTQFHTKEILTGETLLYFHHVNSKMLRMSQLIFEFLSLFNSFYHIFH